MKKHYITQLKLSPSVLLPIFLLFLIYGCKKDATYREVSSETQVQQAQAWYQGAYPPGTSTNTIESSGNTAKLYQFIKPGWAHAQTYSRLNADVIEIPIDSSQQVIVSATQGQGNQSNAHSLSRSSFLILKQAGVYSAFIMTIIADPDYINNDYSKLANNTYQKHDRYFSGILLYTTPSGKLLKGWQYKNGKIAHSLTIGSAPTSGVVIQNLGGGLKTNALVCTTWYLDYYLDGELVLTQSLGTSCVDNGLPDEEGFEQDNGDGGSNPFPSPGGGSVNAYTPLQIREDSLKKHFPCASKLIIDSLMKMPGYANLITGFNTPLKPDLSYRDSLMDWNKAGPNSTFIYQYGLTTRDTSRSPKSSIIFLNTSMLQNSSQFLIASVVIHETLHAIINYNIVEAFNNIFDGQESWMDGINSWYLLKGLPNNFTDHYTMMDYYFSQATALLAQWDNNQHTSKEYAMAMLTGLDNPGTNNGNNPNYALQVQMLQTEYNSLKSQYSITDADLNTFKTSNNNSAPAAKLPNTGCN